MHQLFACWLMFPFTVVPLLNEFERSTVVAKRLTNAAVSATNAWVVPVRCRKLGWFALLGMHDGRPARSCCMAFLQGAKDSPRPWFASINIVHFCAFPFRPLSHEPPKPPESYLERSYCFGDLSSLLRFVCRFAQ